MNDISQNGKFTAFIDIVAAPVVGKLVARFLPSHALLNPLVASPMLLPDLPCTIERQDRIANLLHALIAHLGEPEFDGLGLGTEDGLH